MLFYEECALNTCKLKSFHIRIQRKEARNMAIKLAVGDESFDEIRKTGLYYVDKTETTQVR